MFVVAAGRGEGKSKGLLDWAGRAPEGEVRVIVSARRELAMRLLRRSRQEGRDLQSWQFVCVDELGRPGLWSAIRGNIVLGYDDVELCLNHMTREGRKVGAMSFTSAPYAPSPPAVLDKPSQP